MASNNRKAPSRWPPKNGDDRNRNTASRAQTGGSLHAKRRIDNKKVQETLDEMFINIFDSEIIRSVAHSCGWKLNKSIEALIMLAEGSEFPDNKFGNSSFQTCTFSEGEKNETSLVSLKSKSVKDTSKTEKTAMKEPHSEDLFIGSSSSLLTQTTKKKSLVMNTAQGTIKVAYKGRDEISDDDDADVVIEEENEFEVSEFDPTFSGASSQSLYQFLTPFVSPSQLCNDNKQVSLENSVRENNPSHAYNMVTAKPKQTVADSLQGDKSLLKISVKKGKHWPKFEKVKKLINDGIKVMVLMRGCPGSGKTSLARHIIKSTYGECEQKFIFSADNYFILVGNGKYSYNPRLLPNAHKWNQQQVGEEVQNGTNPIIIDNTNLEAWEIEPYVRMAVQFGYIVEFLEPRTSWRYNPVELERKNSHGVPRRRIEDMLARFERDLTPARIFSLFNLRYSLLNMPPQYVSKRKPATSKEGCVVSGVKKEIKENKNDEGKISFKTKVPSQSDLPKPLQLSGVLGSDVAEKEIRESLDVLLSEWNRSVMEQSNKKLNEAVSLENGVSSIDKHTHESLENIRKTGIGQPHDLESNNFRFIDSKAGGVDEIYFMAEGSNTSEEEKGEEIKFENVVSWDNEGEDNRNHRGINVPDLNYETEDSRDLEDESKCMYYVMVLNDGTLLPQKSYFKENNSACQSKIGERKWEYLLMTEDSKLLFHPIGSNASEVHEEGDSEGFNIPANDAQICNSKDILDIDGNVAVSSVDDAGSQITREEVTPLDSLLFEFNKKENLEEGDSVINKSEESKDTEREIKLEAKFSGMDSLEVGHTVLMNIAFKGVEDSSSKDSLCNPPEIETRNEDVMAVETMKYFSCALEEESSELTFVTESKAAISHSSSEQTNVFLNPHNSTSSGDEISDDVKLEIVKEHENSELLEFKFSREEACVTLDKIEPSPEISKETSTDLISFIALCQEKQSILTKGMQARPNLSISSTDDTREKDILQTWEYGTSWDEQETDTIDLLIPKIVDSSMPKPARNMRRQTGMESSLEKGEEKENKIDIFDADNSEQWSAVEEPIATWEEENSSMDREHEKLSESVGPQPQRKIFAKQEDEGEEKTSIEELCISSCGIKLASKEELTFLQPVSLSDVLGDDLEGTNKISTDPVGSLAVNVPGSVSMEAPDSEVTHERLHSPAVPDFNVEFISDGAGCSRDIGSILEPKKNILHSSTNTHHEDFITLGNVNTRLLDAAPGVKILPAKSRDIIDSDALTESKREVKKIRPILMLDKSSMTYDIVSSPPETENVKEQLQELVKMFPNCSLQDLLEIFEKCNKDINWTVDLLLESASQGIEISTPNSSRGNEPDCGILVEINSSNSGTMENASIINNESTSNTCPEGETLAAPCNSSRISPVSPESCAKSTLINKRTGKKDRTSVSETSLLLKKQLEENIVINEEHYSEHVSRIRKLRHGEVVESGGIPQEGDESFGVDLLQENVGNLSSEEFLLEQRGDMGAASVFALRPDAPEWSDCEPSTQAAFEEHEEEETVFLKIDAAFAEQLHTLFGTASLPFNKDKEPTINIPLSLARQLHSYVMEAEQNTYDQMMQEDEELARTLQLQDDKKIAEASATTSNHVPDLQEIMDMEMALAMYKADQKNSRNETKEDLATKLTKNLLCEWFPSVPKDILMNVFEAHNNSFEDTLEVLLASTEEDSSVRIVMTAEARAAHEKALLDKANLESRKNKENEQQYCDEREQVTSEEALEDAKYYRSEANRHCCLRNECQNKAQKAYQQGHTAVAAYYSQMAMLHKERIEENNAKAASSLLLAHSLGNLNTTLDLHFLYVVEALQVLDMFLDHHIQNLVESNHRSVPVFVITGRGARSSGGRSRIKPAVLQRLEQRGLRHEEVNPGLLKVFVTKSSASSAKMMAC